MRTPTLNTHSANVCGGLVMQFMTLTCAIIVFAPVALIIKYETIEEAIAIANSTRYGLGASVFGPDQEQCVKVARRLECGMVSINDFGVFYVSGTSGSVRPFLLTDLLRS